MAKRFQFALWCVFALTAHAGDFSLTNRIRFTNQHVDIRVVYQPAETNTLSFRLRDGDRGVNHPATNVLLVALEAARVELPDGFDAFGTAGDPFWILPQSQDPALLYAGFSAEGLPRDLFAGRTDILLRRVSGPGSFFVWQADQFGGLQIAMNSRDGIDESDRVSPLVGGHDHYNFGFTTNGLYEVTLQPISRPIGAATNLLGEEVTFLFAVEPLPTNAPPELTLWERWQNQHWPSINDPAVIGPDADPDDDGASNVHEFLTGTIPNQADSVRNLSASLIGSVSDAVRLELAIVSERLDSVSVVMESSSTPVGPWNATIPFVATESALRLEESLPAAPAARFYRLRITLR